VVVRSISKFISGGADIIAGTLKNWRFPIPELRVQLS
jgi:cystathionine beta-lyase/cystathionine gamma-synthase